MSFAVASSAPAIAVIATSALASWSLLQRLIPLLRRRLLDQPNDRSAHRQPTPRGGGIAFVLVAAAVAGLTLLRSGWAPLAALPLLALPLALVGLLDDRHNLPAGWRYGAQSLTAVALLVLSPLARSLPDSLPHPALLVWPLAALVMVAITAVINFTNFMDGLDGLVGSCLAVALACAALLLAAPPLALWPLVGALLGFLFWNWSPARVFMGDVGSTFLGAVFAGAVLQVSSWPQALGLLLVLTPVLGDACFCVPRRWLAGQKVFRAHRLHLFQRLHQAGWSHARVTRLYVGSTALLAITLLIAGWVWAVLFALLTLLIGLWLDQRVAVPFAQPAFDLH